MKGIFSILLRLYNEAKDYKLLERWRKEANADNIEKEQGAVLTIPNGYQGQGVDTVIAQSEDKRTILGLTGTFGIILDPLVKNPTAGKLEVVQGLLLATRASEIAAQKMGARCAFIAIPYDMVEYQDIVKKSGFVETAQECKIYRHDFTPVEESAQPSVTSQPTR